jgi:hypothetical protein
MEKKKTENIQLGNNEMIHDHRSERSENSLEQARGEKWNFLISNETICDLIFKRTLHESAIRSIRSDFDECLSRKLKIVKSFRD